MLARLIVHLALARMHPIAPAMYPQTPPMPAYTRILHPDERRCPEPRGGMPAQGGVLVWRGPRPLLFLSRVLFEMDVDRESRETGPSKKLLHDPRLAHLVLFWKMDARAAEYRAFNN